VRPGAFLFASRQPSWPPPPLSVNARVSQFANAPTCREESRVMASKGDTTALSERSGRDKTPPGAAKLVREAEMSSRRTSPPRQRLGHLPSAGRAPRCRRTGSHIDRCAWVIARCVVTRPEESAQRFQWRCERIPTSVIPERSSCPIRGTTFRPIYSRCGRKIRTTFCPNDLRPLRALAGARARPLRSNP